MSFAPSSPHHHQSNPPEPKMPVVEDLSRMEGEYGMKMLGKLKQMHILLVGVGGLGVEVAKNLILAGPHTVVVHDKRIVQVRDMGTNFYTNTSNVGQPIAHASLPQLGELNPNVNVLEHSGPITKDVIEKFDVICVTDPSVPLKTLIEWNEIARNRKKLNPDTHAFESSPTAFILSTISGGAGLVFSDFGNDFHVFDADGVPVRSVVIEHVSQAANGIVEIDGERHLLQDGDFVKIEEVRGMSDQFPLTKPDGTEHTFLHNQDINDINNIVEIKTTKNPKKFSIGNTLKLNEYHSGGIATQIKQTKSFQFQSLQHQLTQPRFISGYMDFTKFGRDLQLHVAYLAVYKFQEQTGRFPALHSQEDANKVLEIAKQLAAADALQCELDAAVVAKVALYYDAELPPMAALFGGIVAQEITKHTGKYTPIQQFFYFDAFEMLNDTVPADAKPIGSRYDHQIAVFGKSFQDKIGKCRTFLVGCGALGCEYIKAFAMTGLGCHGGTVYMTDDDRIELSNLSRQFLFRRKHVGHPKSVSAAEAAVQMNPDLKAGLNTLEKRVEPKSEDTFNDEFWDGLDFVVNALDNQPARKYVDSKCVLHKKPLFESGTLGTQANSVICLPYKTPSYSEGAVAGEEQGIAKCTLRNFPSDVVHCIEWAREKFDDLFVSGADLANSLLEDRESFFNKLKQDPLTELDALKTAKKWLEFAKTPSFETCVSVILTEFLTNYRNAINDLTHAFPADARIKDTATGADLGLFWHGHKRFPQTAAFDAVNDEHIAYLHAGANILAAVFGIPEQSVEKVRHIAKEQQAHIKPWVYSGKVEVDEKNGGPKKGEADEKTELKDEDEAQIAALTAELRSLNLATYKRLNPQDFEKDDDRNHHIDFITAATNLRAWNYHLKPATRQKCRMISGKIIPAIATTTATITGFIGLEIYKYIKGVALEQYRAASINLATNVFCCENLPDPVKKKSGLDPQTYMQVVAIPEGWTVWENVVIKGPGFTLQQFMDEFTNVHHGAVIDMLATEKGAVLYNSMDAFDSKRKELVKQRLNTPLIDIYTQLSGPIFPPERKYILLDCSVEDESGNPGIVPPIKYIFRD